MTCPQHRAGKQEPSHWPAQPHGSRPRPSFHTDALGARPVSTLATNERKGKQSCLPGAWSTGELGPAKAAGRRAPQGSSCWGQGWEQLGPRGTQGALVPSPSPHSPRPAARGVTELLAQHSCVRCPVPPLAEGRESREQWGPADTSSVKGSLGPRTCGCCQTAGSGDT